MRGRLHEEIRIRPKAGFFNEPYFRGLALHLSYLEGNWFACAPCAADDWIDRGKLTLCLQKGSLGIGDRRIPDGSTQSHPLGDSDGLRSENLRMTALPRPTRW